MRLIDQVDTQKLHLLAGILDDVPAPQFNMAMWVQHLPHRPGYLARLLGSGTECGFAGCALGWAAFSGKFEGLRLVAPSEDNHGYVVFGGRTGYYAGAILF